MKVYQINCAESDYDSLISLGVSLGILLPRMTVIYEAVAGFTWSPDEVANGKFTAKLGVEGDFAALAAVVAAARPDVAMAMQELERYFVVDESGKPVSEDV